MKNELKTFLSRVKDLEWFEFHTIGAIDKLIKDTSLWVYISYIIQQLGIIHI